MSYTLRIIIISATLVVLTVAAIVFAPKIGDITVVAQTPTGSGAALDSTISVSFSRPVDQRSAENAFVLYPPVPGRFAWRGQTMIFQPIDRLQAHTLYRVTIRPGLRDLRGHTNRFMTSWPFMTR